MSVKSHDHWMQRKREILEHRQKEIDEYLKEGTVQMSEEEKNRIRALGVKELRAMVLEEKIRITTLLRIFYEKALTKGVELHALADIDIKGCIEQANELEFTLKNTPKEERDSKLGELFGIPISVKDNMVVKGTYATLGCMAFADVKQPEHKIYGHLITKHGGIPFVKSNVPMLLKTSETVNNLYGRALNPWNRERTPGGSSGGEGALIASCCSPAGFGSDIGGSIRTPASYNAIWGLKPTGNRFSLVGGRVSTTTGKRFPNTTISAAYGPMARTVDDLVILTKVMNDEDMARSDRLIHHMPWNENLYKSTRKLRIGYFDSCKVFPSCSAVKRAVAEAVEIGRKLGHEMVKMDVDISDIFYHTVFAICAGSFTKSMIETLKGEKMIDEYRVLMLRDKVPDFLVRLIGWFKNKNPKRFFLIINSTINKTIGQLVESCSHVEQDKKYFEKLMIDNELDAWLAPVSGLPPLRHSHASHLILSSVYTMLFNVLNYPAGSVPITFVRPDEETYECGHRDEVNKYAKETMRNSKGLPIGVQIACKPFKEELLLNLMKQFEGALPKISYPIDG